MEEYSWRKHNHAGPRQLGEKRPVKSDLLLKRGRNPDAVSPHRILGMFAPDSCLHPANLEHNRAPSSTPPSMKLVRLGVTSNSGQRRLVSWSRSDQVATPGLCWLKSQHRWLVNMKRLFNVKKPLIFFFSRLIPSVPASCTENYEPRRKGISTKTLNILARYHFCESQIRVLNTCLWIHCLFWFV